MTYLKNECDIPKDVFLKLSATIAKSRRYNIQQIYDFGLCSQNFYDIFSEFS
jgi:hypothetical protein